MLVEMRRNMILRPIHLNNTCMPIKIYLIFIFAANLCCQSRGKIIKKKIYKEQFSHPFGHQGALVEDIDTLFFIDNYGQIPPNTERDITKYPYAKKDSLFEFWKGSIASYSYEEVKNRFFDRKEKYKFFIEDLTNPITTYDSLEPRLFNKIKESNVDMGSILFKRFANNGFLFKKGNNDKAWVLTCKLILLKLLI